MKVRRSLRAQVKTAVDFIFLGLTFQNCGPGFRPNPKATNLLSSWTSTLEADTDGLSHDSTSLIVKALSTTNESAMPDAVNGLNTVAEFGF